MNKMITKYKIRIYATKSWLFCLEAVTRYRIATFFFITVTENSDVARHFQHRPFGRFSHKPLGHFENLSGIILTLKRKAVMPEGRSQQEKLSTLSAYACFSSASRFQRYAILDETTKRT
jgi:hypothetical protein